MKNSIPDQHPYISLVVTSRNDNHGGRLQFRMQTFLDCLIDQCRRHRLPAEILMVEWNPPKHTPPLVEVLRWPRDNRNCPVRIIQVPPHIHEHFQYSDRLPLFQMIAKNVGIRRARAPFILATNIDILFSEDLIEYFSSRQLDPSRMYRVDRYDVPAELPTEKRVPELLQFCRENPIRIHKRWGSMNARTGRYYSRSTPWKTKLYILYSMLFRGGAEKMLHTNGCGDFTLLSKETWFAIRGYPELPLFSMNIDGLGCQIAYFAGARETVLKTPMEIYHIEHSLGWTPEGQEKLATRIRDCGVSQLDYQQYRSLAIRMRKEKRPIIVNGDNWGLADEFLTETTISQS